jgi:hypothetical protein
LQGRRERLRLLPGEHSGITALVGRRHGTFVPTPGGMAGSSMEL